MPCYFIANIRMRDAETYGKYLDECDEVFAKFGGKYLAVDESPVVLEGSWPYTKCVVIMFESREKFDAWYDSEEYRRILEYRLAGAECDTILVAGG